MYSDLEVKYAEIIADNPSANTDDAHYVHLIKEGCDATLITLSFLFRIFCVSNRPTNHNVVRAFVESFLYVNDTLLIVHEAICDGSNAWAYNQEIVP